MNTDTKILHISPMVAVADMEATVRFYSDVLGFKATMHSSCYSIMERDGATLHLMKVGEKVMQTVRGHIEIYIEVSNINPLWEHVRRFKDDYRIRDLFDRDYGMREFHIADPNDCLVFVGQKID